MEENKTHIVNPQIENYLNELLPPLDQILEEMEQLAKERNFPIVGPLVGRLLNQLALAVGAKQIFEMGSGFGYSAYWFAKALGDEGKVVFTEFSERNTRLAEDFLSRGELDGRVEFYTGDAVRILKESDGGYDIIFNDIDKENYPSVVELAYQKLRSGGLFITDNVLWSGRVMSDASTPSTQGVKEFTRLLIAESGFLTTLIPLRDGVSVSLKL